MTSDANDVPTCSMTLVPQSEEPFGPSLIRDAYTRHCRAQATEYIRWLADHPQAPEDLLLELCERGEFLDVLGHRRGPRILLERLASRHHYPEAILTIGKALYTDEGETAAQLRAFLTDHRECRWLFESLAHAAANPPEKELILLEAVKSLPFLEEVRQVLEERRLERLAEEAIHPEEIERLYHLHQPKVWRGLASNAHTPVAFLQVLREVKGVQYSREIRTRAKVNLERQSQP